VRHLSLHITTTQNSDKIFSAVHGVLYKNDYGVIFWMCSEEGFIEMGLVVKQEMKQRAKEEIGNHLMKNRITDFKFIHPIPEQVSNLWMQWYMPKKYNLRFA
jgi:hypothetical protein